VFTLASEVRQLLTKLGGKYLLIPNGQTPCRLSHLVDEHSRMPCFLRIEDDLRQLRIIAEPPRSLCILNAEGTDDDIEVLRGLLNAVEDGTRGKKPNTCLLKDISARFFVRNKSAHVCQKHVAFAPKLQKQLRF